MRGAQALVLLVVGILSSLVLSSAPASAHASQVGSSPAADEVLTAAPSEVRIDFDSGLLDMGAALVVRNEAKESITAGPTVVGDRILAVPVDPEAPAGTYTVAFRVVSADGHTVEGSFNYTIEEVTPSVEADANSTASQVPDDPTAEPAASPVSEPTPTPTAAPEEGGPALPLLLFGGVGVVLILGIAGALLLRR